MNLSGLTIDSIELYILIDTSLSDLDFDSRSQGCEKAKSSVPIISQSSPLIWLKLGKLFRLISLTNLTLVLPSSNNIEGREHCIFIE